VVSDAERNERRRRAGERAATFVEDGMVVGLGTGRTADHATRALAARVAVGLRIVGVPTSHRTALLASSLGITVGTLEEHPRLDIAIDGADEVDPQLRVIKGLGGALLREKIVAAASARFVVVVDDGKLVSRLGETAPVPVEVLPFGCSPAAERLRALGAEVVLREAGAGPFVTDNAHYLLDCRFGPLADPERLEADLRSIPGVLGTGLFIGMTDTVIVGTAEGIEERPASSPPPPRAVLR
jgi:ribose 5-phosphate isomerase A